MTKDAGSLIKTNSMKNRLSNLIVSGLLLFVFPCIAISSCLMSCKKESDVVRPYRMSVSERIDSFDVNGKWVKSWYSLHWHEPTVHKDSLERYRQYDGMTYTICPPVPMFATWIIRDDTCR